ncbi:MAG: methyltransferase domain-containing protein, partial [Bacteroidota bacterium]|nr:methyltransferase domain-containing protein [Bacteroidota bacterium]
MQDYSSQQVLTLMQLIKDNDSTLAVWDCCAASGGKSILANDVWGNIQLTVSDVRESVLHNLVQRFKQAKIKNYTAVIADVSKPLPTQLANKQFEVIIADVPCTGSGTWSRTPEQLYFFSSKQIENYSLLQKDIVHKVIPQLKPGGYFLYITCSVFKQENEQIVNQIIQQEGLHLIKQLLLTGYHIQADTMFAALLQKPMNSK